MEAYAVVTKVNWDVVRVEGVYLSREEALKKMREIAQENGIPIKDGDEYASHGDFWVKIEPTDLKATDSEPIFNYNVGDVVTIDTDDYPALPKEMVEFFRQYEDEPLVIEKRFSSKDGEVGYYYASHNGKTIINNGRPFPFIDADLKPFRTPILTFSVNEEKYEFVVTIDNLDKKVKIEFLSIDEEIVKEVNFSQLDTNKIENISTRFEEDEAGVYHLITLSEKKGAVGAIQFKINDEGVFVDFFDGNEKIVIESFFVEKE